MGSRDRKTITALCYSFFRVAHLFGQSISIEDKITYGAFIIDHEQSEWIQNIRPDLYKKSALSLTDKFRLLNVEEINIFPNREEWSREINHHAFALSFFKQPKVFIRIRPGREEVLKKMEDAAQGFDVISSSCLAFTRHINLENMAEIDSEFVIQDLSSQKIFDGFQFSALFQKNNQSISVWDCCAASGGKSILFSDLIGRSIKLTVSDIRKNILNNLKARLSRSGIDVQKIFTQDLSSSSGLKKTDFFDVVICDAPCTGSGTWSRNPEQLFSFDTCKLDFFVKRQYDILSNVIPHVSPNGYFFYITCSVFEKENEGVVNHIRQTTRLSFIEMKYLHGYNMEADTMFVAIFKNEATA